MGRMGPERDIDDPALQRMKLGPDVEPTEPELLKTPPENREVAATRGPAAFDRDPGPARPSELTPFNDSVRARPTPAGYERVQVDV
jgi:hypothetical protein